MALLQGVAMAVPVALAATPIGLAIDRGARNRMVFVLSVCTVAGSVLTALASSFDALFAARCLIGLAGPAVWMATMSLLADLYPAAQRGRANTVIVIGQCVGNSVAFALGGWLYSIVDPGPDAWRIALLGLAIPLAVITMMTLGIREPKRTEQTIQRPSIRQSFAHLLRYRGAIAPLLGGLAMLGVADGAAVTWAAPVFSRQFALSPERVGAIMGVVLLASGIVGPIVGGVLADSCQRRGGSRRTVTALAVLAAVTIPAAFFGMADTVTVSSALFFLFMMLSGATIVGGTTLFTIVVPNDVRGLCLSWLSASFLLLGFGAAPLMVSILSGALGGGTMIGSALGWVCAITCLMGAVALTCARQFFSVESRS